MNKFLKYVATGILAVAIGVGISPALYHPAEALIPGPSSSATVGPHPVPTGGGCLPVTSFGADPTGAKDSTAAFNLAVNNSPNGTCIGLPQGTYTISGDITETCPNGVCASIIGQGAGLVQINETNLHSFVFDSCPDSASSTPHMPTPAACVTAPSVGNKVTGVIFSGFTVNYILPNPNPGGLIGAYPTCWTPCGANTGELAGVGPSVFYFPAASGVTVQNVSINNAWDCFDFGNEGDGTNFININNPHGEYTCYGHLLGYHGGTGYHVIGPLEYTALRGTNNAKQLNSTYQGVGIDFSDVVNVNQADNIQFEQVDLEGGSMGVLGLMQQSVFLADMRFDGTLIDGYTMCAYCWIAMPFYGNSSPGATQHITACDKWATSWYDSVLLDGGGYTGATGGPKGMSYACGANYDGANSRAQGSSLFFVEPIPGSTVAPGGYAQDGSSIGITYNPTWDGVDPTPTPFSCVYQLAPGDNPRTATYALMNACGSNELGGGTPSPGGAPVQLGWTYSGDPDIGIAPATMWTMAPCLNAATNGYCLPTPGATGMPYTVTTTGSLVAFGPNSMPSPFPLCTPLAGQQTGGKNSTPAPCYSSQFDFGDGFAFMNGARGQHIVGVHSKDSNGSAINCWPNSCRQLFASGNTFGEGDSGGNGVQFGVRFPASNPPTDYFIANNDLYANLSAFVNPPVQTFVNHIPNRNGQGAVIINNRSFPGVTFTGQSWNASPSTLYNNGPYNCTIFFSISGITLTSLAVNGQNLPINAGTGVSIQTFPLPAFQNMTLTYSAGTPATFSGICTG